MCYNRRSDTSRLVGGHVSDSGGPAPAVSIIPTAVENDPFFRQLRAENERLRQRNAALERRLALFDATIQRITAVVREVQGAKGVHG